MEKRFELKYNKQKMRHYAVDHKLKKQIGYDDMINLLNEQNEKIKELKKEIKQLKFDCAMYKSANYLINDIGIDKAREIMFQSEKKLQQSQNQKAIEVLENIKIQLREKVNKMQGKEHCYPQNAICWEDVVVVISNQIAELKGGEENE